MAFDIFIKFYTVPDFTDDTVLAKKPKTLMKMLHKHPPKIMKTLLKRRSFRINGMKLLKKDITETFDIATKF